MNIIQKTLIMLCLTLFCLDLAAQKRPNVIFILADDLGYGDLGCYGQKLIQTPNLDKLASSGIRFKQFYAGTSVCAPSRAALITGLHTGHTAVRGNFEIQPEGQFPLAEDSFTIADLFKKAGYATSLFGKWGLGYPGSSGEPNKQGFDVFFGYNCQRQSHNFFPDHLWDNNKRIECSNTPTNQQEYAPDLIQKKALAFLEANSQNPFFMCLTYTLPHAALQIPKDDPLLKKYKEKFKETPKIIPATWDGIGYQPQAYPLATYAAMVGRLDSYVGEVVSKLKELGIEKNTLIVFTSDNGPHREGGNIPEFFNSSGKFRGIKRDLFEGGIRAPMIVSWPAMVKKGKESPYVGASWDFLPTFANLLNQKLPVKTDGISILPTIVSETRKQKQHDFLYWEFHEDGGKQAVRMGNWKGVRLNVKKDKNAPILLYDLGEDPFETKDLSSQHQDILKEISLIMETEHIENANFPLLGVSATK